MFFATQATTGEVDTEHVYWLLAIVTSMLTGAIELWRQRGVEGKIDDLKSDIQSLQVDVRYHGKLIDDLNGGEDEDS
jgi:hypothetical protein